MIEEFSDRMNKFNYILINYKLDSTKIPSSQFHEIYKEFFERIINEKENLDLQNYLKMIDSFQININQLDSNDLYIITTNLTLIALQMNINSNKRELYSRFIEKNINYLKHEVLLLYQLGVFAIFIQALFYGD